MWKSFSWNIAESHWIVTDEFDILSRRNAKKASIQKRMSRAMIRDCPYRNEHRFAEIVEEIVRMLLALTGRITGKR